MQTRVKVIVDSTAGVSPALAQQWDIGVVPLSVTWNGVSFRDGLDPLPSDFYRQLARHSTNPITATPSPGDFHRTCENAFAEGFQQVLIVTVSVRMSSTFNSARIAAEEYDDGIVAALDSGQGAGALALTAAYAAQVARQGAKLREVLKTAKKASQCTKLYMALDTLVNLRRSGRLSATQAAMGSLLQIKPILTIENGQLQVVDRVRTIRRATSRMLEYLEVSTKPEHMMVMFADTLEAARELKQILEQRFPEAVLDISPVSAVIGGHAGPGLLGISVRYTPFVE